ncbi:MAG: methyltransferase domain-containing protein [Lentisphaeria bacterium]|nr:methyltransferase domain-containing protein [Lentisphaeria bacterium]MDP7741506.1 methyltransferase domain-containing protein [Lentisphaeria bacterium]
MEFEINKALVARRFTNRAAAYDGVSSRQATMAQALLGTTQARMASAPGRILELGSGTGTLTSAIRRTWPAARLVAIDLSQAMLDLALSKADCADVDFRCGDAESMIDELAGAGPFDLVISSAAVQWFADGPAAIQGYCELLRAGGLASIATFGPDTFQELSQAFRAAAAEIDRPPYQRVLTFPAAAAWRQALAPPRLDVDIIEERQTEWFDTVPDMLAAIRGVGAGNANRHYAPIGKRLYAAMTRAYRDRFGGAGPVPATFHMQYIYCRRAD